jgi:hypothetical protein
MTRRTSNSAQSFGAGCVGSLAIGSLAMGRRPAIRLRTIKKTAEILNISECSVRRLHQVGRAARSPPGMLRSDFRRGYRGSSRHQSHLPAGKDFPERRDTKLFKR